MQNSTYLLAGLELFKTSINYFRELKFNFRAQVKEGEPPNEFANSLSHMRMGVLNPNDCMYLTSLFRSRSFCENNPMSGKELWLFARNANVDRHNEGCFHKLCSQGNFAIRVVAKHFRNIRVNGVQRVEWADSNTEERLLQTRSTLRKKKEKKHLAYIDLCIGSRVRCSENLLIGAGLTNGAQGTVVGFLFEGQDNFVKLPLFKDAANDSATREIPVVLVQFDYNEKDNDAVALALKNSFLDSVPNVFPIFATEMVGSSKISIDTEDGKTEKWTRTQLPLLPGHARTGHSSQGLTGRHGVIVNDLDSTFFAFAYVGIRCGVCVKHLIDY